MPETLDRDPLLLVYDLGRLIRTRADQDARRHGMTRAQWMILARLQRQEGLSQKELAAILEVEPISVGRLVDRLEARGMVERRADPADRRIWRLYLMPAAAPMLEEIAVMRRHLHDLIAAGIAPEAMAVVIDSLGTMKANLVADMRGDDRRAESA